MVAYVDMDTHRMVRPADASVVPMRKEFDDYDERAVARQSTLREAPFSIIYVK